MLSVPEGIVCSSRSTACIVYTYGLGTGVQGEARPDHLFRTRSGRCCVMQRTSSTYYPEARTHSAHSTREAGRVITREGGGGMYVCAHLDVSARASKSGYFDILTIGVVGRTSLTAFTPLFHHVSGFWVCFLVEKLRFSTWFRPRSPFFCTVC